MNISTLAKILGVSTNDLRSTGEKNRIYGFKGRNTRIPYNSALAITKIIKPEKLAKLKNDDRIYLAKSMTVAEFAESIDKPAGVVIKTMLMSGVMATLNEKIDYDTASLIASEMNLEVFPMPGDIIDEETKPDNLSMIKMVEYDTEDKEYVRRSPVVTVMGHVDHGKTTLLDTIRKSNVVSGEAGAITQHISSYAIEYMSDNKELAKSDLVKGKKGGFKITFVDTPGHEAFAAMRARGTQMADFIILMVSAIEGPKPQTVEVIERAKLSKTPVIVAINKIDLPSSDIERAKAEIAGFGLTPEEWGGDTPFIPISAKTGENIPKLIETILQHAEMANLEGQVNCPGQGVVIESHLDRTKGVESTTLVVKENLKVGDIIRCGEYVSKIKRIETTESKVIQKADLCDPIIVYGLPEVVNIGEPVIVYKNQRQAQVDADIEKLKRQSTKKTFLFDSSKSNKENQINIILKADVLGSLEAFKEALLKIPQEKVKLFIKAESVGELNENDIDFAKITESTILAFHTKYSSSIENMIQKEKVSIISSDIIYELLNWAEEEIVKNTKHDIKVEILGRANILALFRSEKASLQVCGGEVFEGTIVSNKPIRVIRGDKEIGRLEVEELQNNKVKTTDVKRGLQFGMSLSGKTRIAKGDILESIDEIVIK